MKMIVKTGLLILTNPINITKILPIIHRSVQNTLYIQLTTGLSESLSRYKGIIYTTGPKYTETIRGIYSQAATLCQNLDVRVLLSTLKFTNVTEINTYFPVETVIFDTIFEKSQIDSFMNNYVPNKNPDYNIWIFENSKINDIDIPTKNPKQTYKHTVLGGTFDRLHTGHKILLSEAVLHAEEKVTVGVTDTNMISGKLLWELIEPCNIRIEKLKIFLNDICPELNYNIVPIKDPFGPTQSDPTMGLIIVSSETLRGGEKVNEIRSQQKLSKLEIDCVDLVDNPSPEDKEETKISSSTNRMRLLGTLIKKPNDFLQKMNPYVIGLTGGIASGKSSVSKHLASFGAELIDCDKIAHDVYKPGKPCHKLIQENFGDKVITENGEINRKVLGGIVFSDKNQLKLLNSIVWPEIAKEVQEIISSYSTQIQKVIVVEAAVLLTAGWDTFCHEVWTCIIPPEEAVRRLQNRNNLSVEEAQKRLNSQPPNIEQIASANVIFSTIWELEYTRKLVEKAWTQLQKRLLEKKL